MSCTDIAPCSCGSNIVVSRLPASKTIQAVGNSTIVVAIALKGGAQTLTINLSPASTPGSSVTVVNMAPQPLIVRVRYPTLDLTIPCLQSRTFYFFSNKLGWASTQEQLLSVTSLHYNVGPDSCGGTDYNLLSTGALYYLGISNSTWIILDGALLANITFFDPGTNNPLGTGSLISNDAIPPNTWCTNSPAQFNNNAILAVDIGNSEPHGFGICIPPGFPTAPYGCRVEIVFTMPNGSLFTMPGYLSAQGNQSISVTMVLPDDQETVNGPLYGNYKVYTQTAYTSEPIVVDNYTTTSFLQGGQVQGIDFLKYRGNEVCLLSYDYYSTTTVPAAYYIALLPSGADGSSGAQAYIGGFLSPPNLTLGSDGLPVPGSNLVTFLPPITNVISDTDTEQSFPLNLFVGFPSTTALQVGAFCYTLTRSKTGYNPNNDSLLYYGGAILSFYICIPRIDICPPTPSPPVSAAFASATYTTPGSPPTLVNAIHLADGTEYNDSVTVASYSVYSFVTIVLNTVPTGTDALLFTCSWQQAPVLPPRNQTTPFSLRKLSDTLPANTSIDILGDAENSFLAVSTATTVTTSTITLKAYGAVNLMLNTISFTTVDATTGDPITTTPNPTFTVASIEFQKYS
jgi:hypothetical protein